ncbi:MAG: M1 family aminopeptidase [Candidatus Eisenbacteria bacterium]
MKCSAIFPLVLCLYLFLPSTLTFSMTPAVDMEKVIVRGVIDPATEELRTVSQIHLRISAGHPQELRFYLNPGREVVKILGPRGNEIAYRTSMRRLFGNAMAFKQISIQIPPELAQEDSVVLTFFIQGRVKDRGFYKLGNYFNGSGMAVMSNVLFPELDVIGGNGMDAFFWLELELTAPSDWTLAVAGAPIITEGNDNVALPSRTALTGDDFDRFLASRFTGKIHQYYCPRIGINIGLFYLYGGVDLTCQTRQVSGIGVRVYAICTDSASASVMLDAAEKTIPALEDAIGPFPFENLAIVLKPKALPFAAGALDSWGMISLPRTYPQNWTQGTQETFVHEMIHQYWNECLQSPTEEALALSEPFAAYLDAELWTKIFADSSTAQISRWSRVNDCANYWWATQHYCERPLVGLKLGFDPFSWSGFYDKGAIGVAMIADLLGPDEFRQFQHEVFSGGEAKKFTLDSLQAAIGRHSKYPCNRLVQDIFKSTTHYDYAIASVKTRKVGSDSCAADIRIVKKQPGEFPMVLKVSFADSSVVERRVEPGLAAQNLQVRGPVPFRQVQLDPDFMTLDSDRFNNVYPRLDRFSLAWGRRNYNELPHPIDDWGGTDLVARRTILSPVLDYTDLDGARFGASLETRNAFRDKKYVWATWSDKQDKLRGAAGWFVGSNVERSKLALHYYDDGLVREAIVTAFPPSWRNALALSLGAGYEERPAQMSSTGHLRYSQSAPSFRLGLTIPYLDNLVSLVSTGKACGLWLNLRKSAAIWGGEMDYLQIDGDTQLGIGPLVMRFRWGLSDGVSNEGEAFPLGGRWGYIDDRVRMVRGYSLRFARSLLLLNASAAPIRFPRGHIVLFTDLARYRELEGAKSHTLLGYGTGIRYALPWANWLESATLRLDYGVPKEGLKRGFVYVGLGSAF